MVTNTTKTSPKAKTSPKTSPTKTSPKAKISPKTSAKAKTSPKLTKVSKSSISKPKKGFPKFLNNLKEILLSFQFHICFQISVGIFVIVMLIIFIIKRANKNGATDNAENFLIEGFKTDTLNKVYESYESKDYNNYTGLRFAFINTILLFFLILLASYDDFKQSKVSLSFLSQAALFIVFAIFAITTPTGKYNNMNYDNSTRISYTTVSIILTVILLSLFLSKIMRLPKFDYLNKRNKNVGCVNQLNSSPYLLTL